MMSWRVVALGMPAARCGRTGADRRALRLCGVTSLIVLVWSINGLRAVTGWGGR
jgi:hypothetical protein